jgi:hypothetical protein
MKNLIISAWGLVQDYKRVYIILNITYYALLIVCMIYVAFNPELQKKLLDEIGAAFMTGPVSFVGQAYVNVQVLVAIYRAVTWGLLLSPANPDLRLVMIPHSITLIIEGQAYILTMLAAYIHGRAFLWPKSVGVESRARGYLEGLKRTGKLYLLIILILAVAAIYEVIEVAIITKLSS